MNRYTLALLFAILLLVIVWAIGCVIAEEDDSSEVAQVSLVTMAFEKSGKGVFSEVELHVTGSGFSQIDVTVPTQQRRLSLSMSLCLPARIARFMCWQKTAPAISATKAPPLLI